jgi:hypothetical protein
MPRISIVAYLGTLSLGAQTVRIEGTVLDGATGAPVGGATVVLRDAKSRAPLDRVVTGAPGTFELSVPRPGDYAVEASAPGFAETAFTGTAQSLRFTDPQFKSGASDMVLSIVIRLPQSGGLTGRIRDAESREPMSQITVRALRSLWLRGKRQLREEGIAFTDSRGDFHLASLPTGDYVVEIGDNTDPQGKDEHSSSKRYPQTFWPDSDPENIAWVHVPVGVETGTGTIDYAKAEPGRVQVQLSACRPGGGTAVTLYQQVGGAMVRRESVVSSCQGKSLLIPVDSPGTYQLSVLLHSGELPSMLTTADFKVIEGGNLNIELQPPAVSEIRGSVICECEATFVPGPNRTSLGFHPPARTSLIAAFDFNGDGVFEGRTVWSGSAQMEFLNLPPSLYVKRILLNGAETGEFVTVAPGLPMSIDITLSDTPAGLSGTVVRDGKTAPHDHVIVVPWPIRLVDGYPDFVSAQAGGNGEFVFPKLAPGTYKVVSVGPAEWSRKDEPGVVESWIFGIDDTTLGEKESRAVRLESKLP